MIGKRILRLPTVSPTRIVTAEVQVADTPNTSLRGLAAAAGSFTLLALTIIVLAVKGVVTMQLGLLMLVALVGLYLGFGVLIAVYKFIARLE